MEDFRPTPPIPPRVLREEAGRDELNLAEFPLAAIADRVPDDQQTLVFEDQIFDSGRSQMITRRLTISASDKFGLPTALDDEVILGLIQLSKQNRFRDRKVSFSRYQLLRILGWRLEGRSYERLEKSLKRWLGVTLYYDKAWWDKQEQSWVDENFHLLEQVTLYDQERRLQRLRARDAELPRSSFTWNEVVFRSFQAGYLKGLDVGLYRQLRYAAAKRMYRFLDKRFYHRQRWEFDLVDFACEHIGLSRNYDTGQLKRQLQRAILELEQIGFLQPLSPAERYVKIRRGEWRIVLLRQAATPVAEASDSDPQVLQQVIDHGVTPSVAAALVREYPLELIRTQLEVLRRLLEGKAKSAIRNPAGYLVQAIRDGYVPPAHLVQRPSPRRPPASAAPADTPAADPVQPRVEAYLNSLSPAALDALAAEALASAEPTLAEGYHRSRRTGGATLAVYRRMLLERGARRILGQHPPTHPPRRSRG